LGKEGRFAVNRYHLTRYASGDLDEICLYLEQVPEQYASRIRQNLRKLIHEIASHPDRGTNHSGATRILGQETRTRITGPYKMFYRDNRGTPEILAILHMARDVEAILTMRVQ
jgi:plasmid stabilization system protein ParE